MNPLENIQQLLTPTRRRAALRAGAPCRGEACRSRHLWFWPLLVALLLVGGLSALAQPVITGPTLVTGLTDPGLNIGGTNYVLAEYYGKDYGPLQVSNVMFVNGNARLVGASGPTTQNPPNFGAGQDAANLALILGNNMYHTYPGFDIFLPSLTAGHTYKVQFLFRDNYNNAVNKRMFNVLLGGYSAVDYLDLVAAGAGYDKNTAIVITATFVSDGNPFEIVLATYIDNPMISAITVEDMAPVTLPPMLTLVPKSATNYPGRSVTFSGWATGSRPISYQWMAGAIGSGLYTNLSDGLNTSGSATPTLTISNLTAGNAADYVLVASNSAGATTSAPPARLTLLTPGAPITPGSSYPYFIMTNNPAAYWRLNDPAGSPMFYDSSPGLHDGPTLSATTFGVAGPQNPPWLGFEANNTALKTAGSGAANDWLQTSSPLNLDKMTTNNVTLIAWVNPAGNQAAGTAILLERNNNNSGTDLNKNGLVYNTYPMGDGDMELGYMWAANNYAWRSGLEVPHNTWSMVALVITTNSDTLYICNSNGMRSAVNVSQDGINKLTQATPWNATTYIGYDPFAGGYARQFNGSIDEVAILATSLTSDQILALYGAAVGVSGFKPQIAVQPSGASVGLGATKSLATVASGTAPLSYQWQAGAVGSGVFTNLSDTLNFTGSQTNTLKITGFGGRTWRTTGWWWQMPSARLPAASRACCSTCRRPTPITNTRSIPTARMPTGA